MDAPPETESGGGLHVTGTGTVMIRNSEFRGNSAAQEGGGLGNGTDTITVFHTNIAMNSGNGDEPHDGVGSILNDGGALDIRRPCIVGNTDTTIEQNTSPAGPDIFQDGPVTGGEFTVDGDVVAEQSISGTTHLRH